MDEWRSDVRGSGPTTIRSPLRVACRFAVIAVYFGLEAVDFNFVEFIIPQSNGMMTRSDFRGG